jgi:hypothetical protein
LSFAVELAAKSINLSRPRRSFRGVEIGKNIALNVFDFKRFFFAGTLTMIEFRVHLFERSELFFDEGDYV